MTTPHAEQPGQSAPGTNKTGTADTGVPAIPQWVKDWGIGPLAVAFLLLTGMIADVGHAHGKGIGWFLFFLLLAACATAWILNYERRVDKARQPCG